MTNKPVDGFSVPASVGERMAKARAARSLKTDKPADTSEEAGGVYAGMDKRPSSTMQKGTPLRAIRAHCLDCTCGSYNEVALCPAPDCPLHPFRFGKRPATIRRKQAEKDAAAEGGAP